MKHNFVLGKQGGWLRRLPEEVATKITERWPNLPLSQIEREFGYYFIERESRKGQASASEIKATFGEFQKAVSHLRGLAEPIGHSNLGLLIQQTAEGEYYEALPNLIEALMTLEAVLPHTAKLLPSGHLVNARHLLAIRIGILCQEAGIELDATPNGVLCQILGLLLSAADEDPTSVVEIVKPILKKPAQK